MDKEFIAGGDVPMSHLPFSPAVRCGEYMFISGQASVDMEGNIVEGTFEEECIRSFENLKRIIEVAGYQMSDIVQVRNYVGRQQDLAEFNQIYKRYFSAPFPARTTLIGCLGTLLKFEVDAVVYIK